MYEDGPMYFYCMTCDARFEDPLFEVLRARERVLFYPEGRFPEVEVRHTDSIGVYCCAPCRARGLSALMVAERVPIPEHPPDIGPIEICARCSGPIDMTAFHLTYSQSEVTFSGLFGQPRDHEYLAVV